MAESVKPDAPGDGLSVAEPGGAIAADEKSKRDLLSVGDELYNLIAITEGDEPIEPATTCANDVTQSEQQNTSAVQKILKEQSDIVNTIVATESDTSQNKKIKLKIHAPFGTNEFAQNFCVCDP